MAIKNHKFNKLPMQYSEYIHMNFDIRKLFLIKVNLTRYLISNLNFCFRKSLNWKRLSVHIMEIFLIPMKIALNSFNLNRNVFEYSVTCKIKTKVNFQVVFCIFLIIDNGRKMEKR